MYKYGITYVQIRYYSKYFNLSLCYYDIKSLCLVDYKGLLSLYTFFLCYKDCNLSPMVYRY